MQWSHRRVAMNKKENSHRVWMEDKEEYKDARGFWSNRGRSGATEMQDALRGELVS